MREARESSRGRPVPPSLSQDAPRSVSSRGGVSTGLIKLTALYRASSAGPGGRRHFLQLRVGRGSSLLERVEGNYVTRRRLPSRRTPSFSSRLGAGADVTGVVAEPAERARLPGSCSQDRWHLGLGVLGRGQRPGTARAASPRLRDGDRTGPEPPNVVAHGGTREYAAELGGGVPAAASAAPHSPSRLLCPQGPGSQNVTEYVVRVPK